MSGMGLLRLLLAMAAVLASASTFALAEKRVALVVGNANYAALGKLPNPGNDARLLAQTLQSVGFVLVGGGPAVNLDKRAFEQAIETFGKSLAPGDVALFFYAGHGLQVGGANYLVPVDAAPTDEQDIAGQLVGVDAVLRAVATSRARLNILILDACRNNPFNGPGLRAMPAGLATPAAPESTLISFATQPGSVALDGDDGDSPFSKVLAVTMRRPGLELFSTFDEVGKEVLRKTNGKQQPWISTSPIAGSFYFVGTDARK